jgi:hypothetical protein
MATIRYNSNMEQLVNASCSLLQHDGEASSQLLEYSPVPPALSAPDQPGGCTRRLKAGRFKEINCHGVKSYEDCLAEIDLDTGSWLEWNGDSDNPTDSKDDWVANNTSDMELYTGWEVSETQGTRNLCAAPLVPTLISPICQ